MGVFLFIMRNLNTLEQLMLEANKKGQLKKATARDCAIIAEAHAVAFMEYCEGLEMDIFLGASSSDLYAGFKETINRE